ncbi:MAG: hypothetical protein Q4B87_03215 [Candidatus Saccharibacteria bacterium]|nr:hypothetical protein [Candidatus Saccharibacteria bacterium]
MKKIIWSLVVGGVLLIVAAFLIGRFVWPDRSLPALPAPELAEGQRGELGIDKNINESTIDNYLGRSDAVYRDVRMLKDPGNYEAIGGDSYLSGFVDGFEVVPLPFIVNVTGLPEVVGGTYTGPTLFTNNNGVFAPNYEESRAILESLFPKDKVIFLMCGGGGYSGMLRQMLIALGWDANKIYDVGGYWYYDGKHKVEVKRTNANGETVYDFYKVPYHEIEFDKLTPIRVGAYIDITPEQYKEMTAEERSFLLMVDQSGCTTGDRLRGYLADFTRDNVNLSGGFYYRMMFDDMKKTSLHEEVKYYPSVVVIKSGVVTAYLKADSDADAEYYNNYEAFAGWLKNNILN